jgi:hypothetical protein
MKSWLRSEESQVVKRMLNCMDPEAKIVDTREEEVKKKGPNRSTLNLEEEDSSR